MSEEAASKYDFDLVVVGGGSGGLACSKEASKLGARVACFDFVKPSTQGNTWGLGGTCVNVGCIPKKLFHYTGLLKRGMEDAKHFGWKFSEPEHQWEPLVENIQNYIRSLNWGYRVSLREAGVKYLNAYASFVDEHTVEYYDARKKETVRVTADKFVIAVGGRPKMPAEVPGVREFAVSSDDIFSLPKAPGKTLVVGASYIALECAGFLHELGYDTTVMVRSILLRGFDQQVAEIIGDIMDKIGVKFIRPATPNKIEKMENGQLKVTFTNSETQEVKEEVYDTVLYAVGRYAVVEGMNLESIGVQMNQKSGKILVNDSDQSSVDNVYAIGDVIDQMELTPVAIKAGVLLAKRLFGGSTRKMDYHMCPTTVFTPYEYGTVGYTQEQAEEKLGAENIEVYLSRFGITEIAASHRVDKDGAEFIKPFFAKLVCDKTANNKVIGFHVIGPEAGEITQGFALGVRLGATKDDFDDLVGIHPTTAEEFTTLSVTLSSGEPFEKVGGC